MLQCTEYKQVRPKWADISRCVRNLLKVHKWNKAKRKGGLNKLIVLDRKLVHKKTKMDIFGPWNFAICMH